MSTEKKIYMSTDYTGEAIAPHQQFVTDAEGNSKWEEKLCWDNGTVVTTLVDNVSVTLTDSYGSYAYIEDPFKLEIIEGKEYIVIWNGTSYTCTAYMDSYDCLAIGNEGIVTTGQGDGAPFFMEMYNENLCLYTSATGAYTLSIQTSNEIVHKIDIKYLPDEALQVYTHPTYTARTGYPTSNATPSFGGTFTISQVTSNSLGHVTNLTNRTVRIPSSTATTSTAGLMSAADKTKLDGLGASDWNQNDETAADYIKNRTHWIEGERTTLIDNVTVTTTTGQSLYKPFTLNLTIGAAYTVIWDNVEYTCIAYAITGPKFPAIGSGRFYNTTDGNNEPFLLFNVSEDTPVVYGYTGTHTVSIIEEGIIHKIDDKYLNLPQVPKNILDGFASGSLRQVSALDSTSIGQNSAAFGESTKAFGVNSFAEGLNTEASGDFSHAEGSNATASGAASHAEGRLTTASNESSHAEGVRTTASGNYSHAEGYVTTASGPSSHAEGDSTIASETSSHAEGYCTTAKSSYQHVQGKYNIEDTNRTYAHIVGNGEGENSRSNAHTLDWSGNAWFAGTMEGTGVILKSSTSGSTKRFLITVNDSGTISATEVTT